MRDLIAEIGQHYMEELPAETAAVRESDDMAAATLARIELLKFKALCAGVDIPQRFLKGVDKGAEDKFPHTEFSDHPPGERIKLSTHLEASKLIREHRLQNK